MKILAVVCTLESIILLGLVFLVGVLLLESARFDTWRQRADERLIAIESDIDVLFDEDPDDDEPNDIDDGASLTDQADVVAAPQPTAAESTDAVVVPIRRAS